MANLGVGLTVAERHWAVQWYDQELIHWLCGNPNHMVGHFARSIKIKTTPRKRMLRKRMLRNNQHALGRGSTEEAAGPPPSWGESTGRTADTYTPSPLVQSPPDNPLPLPDCLQLWQISLQACQPRGQPTVPCTGRHQTSALLFLSSFSLSSLSDSCSSPRKRLWTGNTADSNQSLCLSLSPSMFTQGPDVSASLLLFHPRLSGCRSADRRYAPRFLGFSLIPVLVYKRYG